MSEVGVVEYRFKANTADLEKKLKDTDQSVDKTTSESANKSSAMATAFKAAFAASAAAVVGLGTAAVKSYADYEQLSGGIQTLFKGSADQVMKYANDAYKTAGMSANKYMETVTSFSASLLKSLGGDTAKSAELADMAIRDMADNANKMGASMEAIQYAYQGLAKGNATMLDNLKVGYGGTSTEMLKLAKDMGVIDESVKSFNDIGFDKSIIAIHKLQEKMGITGTTAKEASSTIEGSFNSMKGAWENFITALAGGGNLDESMKRLIETTKTWLGNLIPVVKRIAENLVKIIGEKISEAFNGFRQKLGGWATLIEVVVVAITAAATAFGIWKGAIAAWQAVTRTATAIQTAFNLVMNANPIMLLVIAIAAVVAGLVYFFTQTEVGKSILQGFFSFMGEVFNNIGTWIGGIITNVSGFFVGLWNGIIGIFNGIVSFIQQWGLTILAIIFWPFSLLIGLFFTFKDQIIGFLQGIWNGIVAVFTPVVQFFTAIFQAAWLGIQMVWNFVVWYFTSLWNGIVVIFSAVGGFFIGVFSAAWNGIRNVFGGIIGFFAGIWNGIVGIFNSIGSAIGGAIGGAVRGAVNSVLSFAVNAINGFINMINIAIGVLNAIPGVHIDKLNHLSVPRFATGGIVGPQGGGSLIWAGDGGENEWIVPESKMASLIDKINSQTGGTGGNNYTINVSGTFATSPAEQRKVAELIREQLELNDKRRFA